MEDEGYSSPCEAPDEPQTPINEPSRNTGKLWEETIHANGPDDRSLDKHASRHVEFQYGAIGTRIQQRKVEVSYDAFCKSLDHDPMKCPPPDFPFRYIDTIARNMVPGIRGKTAPNLTTITGTSHSVLDLLRFRFPEFQCQYKSSHALRIRVHLDKLTRQGKLQRGQWRKKQWVGFRLIRHMSHHWLKKALDQGCTSWDKHLQKHLGLLLQAATGGRVGDITRSSKYTGSEYLVWKDIDMTLDETTHIP